MRSDYTYTEFRALQWKVWMNKYARMMTYCWGNLLYWPVWAFIRDDWFGHDIFLLNFVFGKQSVCFRKGGNGDSYISWGVFSAVNTWCRTIGWAFGTQPANILALETHNVLRQSHRFCCAIRMDSLQLWPRQPGRSWSCMNPARSSRLTIQAVRNTKGRLGLAPSTFTPSGLHWPRGSSH